MNKEILISVEAGERRVAVMLKGRLEEFYVERIGAVRLLGNIYKGRVKSVVSGIGGAFVELGASKDGFLYIGDSPGESDERTDIVAEDLSPCAVGTADKPAAESRRPKRSEEIIVQVVKEPIGTKGPRLTRRVSLPGRYVVLMPDDAHRGISKRIEDEDERARLRQIMKDIRIPEGMGGIVRTAAEGASAKELANDVRYLLNLWRRIKSSAAKSKAPVLLHQEDDLTFRIVRDSFREDVTKLITDSRKEFTKIRNFLYNLRLSNFRTRVELYREKEPFFEKNNIEKEIDKLFERKVRLSCGGHIVIEPTESLVAIDVNSGKFTGKGDPEDTVFRVNKEAAKEVARQVILRDLGGIIVIDFIDMEEPSHRTEVFNTLKHALKNDRARSNILSVSELGLVEMTRQRVRKSVESLSYDICSYCKGRGLVKSAVTVGIQVLKKIRRLLQVKNENIVIAHLHPEVAMRLLNQERMAIISLENEFKAKIIIEQMPEFHIEEMKVEVAR